MIPSQSEQRRWSWVLCGLLVLASGLLSMSGWAAPATMELFAAGGNTSAQGPVLTPQTNTYSYNTDNPTGNAVATVYPSTAITYTLENQVYTGSGTDYGLTFGTADSGLQNIYIPLSGQGAPANTDFSSSRLNAANPQGIDVNDDVTNGRKRPSSVLAQQCTTTPTMPTRCTTAGATVVNLHLGWHKLFDGHASLWLDIYNLFDRRHDAAHGSASRTFYDMPQQPRTWVATLEYRF